MNRSPGEVMTDVLQEKLPGDVTPHWMNLIVGDIHRGIAEEGWLIVRGSWLPTAKWNIDKKHRCPWCHTVAIDEERPRWWRVYTCCSCKATFTKYPWLARILPKVGVRCSEHRTKEGQS